MHLHELPLQSAWERLVLRHHVAGKNEHDARLVAATIVHQISSIITFNVQDVARYSEIEVIDPRTFT